MKKIILPVVILLMLIGCSSVKKAVIKDIPLDEQEELLKQYKWETAWTRLILEDIKQKGIVQRDTKIEIIDLDFHWNGSVTVRTPKKTKIVYALEIERPLSAEKFRAKMDEVFWFKSPMMRQVDYIRLWGKKTARAIRNHEVFIGMSLEAAQESWGVPTKTNLNEIGGKREEQWIYKIGNRNKYIYMIDGRVSKWED